MRKLLLLLVLGGAAFVGYSMWRGESAPRTPEEAAFRDADRQIGSHRDAIAFGNTDQARQLADEVAKRMKIEQARAFSGGKQNRTASLTDDNFLTYCQITPTAVCFLIHVPQLKNYHDDVRTALAELAWTVARAAIAERKIAATGDLAIGLRGSMLYGALASGKAGDATPRIETGSSVGREKLHRYFVDAATGATPPSPTAEVAPKP